MYRVTIYNKIAEVKMKSATEASNNKPDYILAFINNVRVHSDGKGYSFRDGEAIWFFKNANKMVYVNYDDNKSKKVSFSFGDNYYEKSKILDLEPDMLDKVLKYQQKRLMYQYKNNIPQNGDIDLHSYTYNNGSVQSVISYRLKKAEATQLYELLEQVKDSK